MDPDSSACGLRLARARSMASEPKLLRCAVYTRKSTEHGLELEFNSLHAQRDACEAYIKSQASQGWRVLPQHYDDPAYSGGNLDRPALKRLLADIDAGKVDVIVVLRIPGKATTLSGAWRPRDRSMMTGAAHELDGAVGFIF